jgi:hypothetical protein
MYVHLKFRYEKEGSTCPSVILFYDINLLPRTFLNVSVWRCDRIVYIFTHMKIPRKMMDLIIKLNYSSGVNNFI